MCSAQTSFYVSASFEEEPRPTQARRNIKTGLDSISTKFSNSFNQIVKGGIEVKMSQRRNVRQPFNQHFPHYHHRTQQQYPQYNLNEVKKLFEELKTSEPTAEELKECEEINLFNIGQLDPNVTNLLHVSCSTAVYRFALKPDTGEGYWGDTKASGALLLYERSGEPKHGIVIMNRIDLDNYNQLLSPTMEFERISPYMLFKDGDDIRCLWFYNKKDCDKFSDLLISFGLEVEVQPDVVPEPRRPGAIYPTNTTGIITPPLTAGSKIFSLLARNVEASQAKKNGGRKPAFVPEKQIPPAESKPVNGTPTNETNVSASGEKDLLSLFKDCKVVYRATEKPPKPMREQDFLKAYGKMDNGKTLDRTYAKKTQKLFNRTNGSGNEILQPTPVKKPAAPWANLFAQAPVQPQKPRAAHGVLPFNRTPLLDHNPLDRQEILEHPKSTGNRNNPNNKKSKGPEQGSGTGSGNQTQAQGKQPTEKTDNSSSSQNQNQKPKIFKPTPMVGKFQVPPNASSQSQFMSLFPSSTSPTTAPAKANFQRKGLLNEMQGQTQGQGQGNIKKRGGKKTKRQLSEGESKQQQQQQPPSDRHFLPIQRESTKGQEKEKEKENDNDSSKDLQKLLLQMQIFDKSTKPEQNSAAGFGGGEGNAQGQTSGDSTIFGPVTKRYD